MSHEELPAPVIRYLHRPLWWAAGVGLFVVLLLGLDLQVVREQDARFAESAFVDGQTVAPWDGRNRLIDVSYPDPRQGNQVRGAIYNEHPADPPALGATVRLQVAKGDPTSVRLAEDPRQVFDDFTFYFAGVVLAMAFWLARRRHVVRQRRIMSADITSYAMKGAILAPDGFHLRWRLFLYPLDGAVGAAPVCAVALLDVPSVASGVFPVEVKGEPRAFGTFVVRSGDELLWLRGRALPRAVWPMPATEGEFVPSLPLRGPRPGGSPPSMWPPRLVLIGTLLGLAAAQWANVEATLAAKHVLERSRPVSAVVVSAEPRNGGRSTVTLRYRVGDRDFTRSLVMSGLAEPGNTVTVRYDTLIPENAWDLSVEFPPGSGTAGGWYLGIMVLVPAALVGHSRLRARRLALVGARELLADGRITSGTPPLTSVGLTYWDGSLELREVEWSAIAAATPTGVRLRFETEALVTVDRRGRSTRCSWDDEALIAESASPRVLDRVVPPPVAALVRYLATTPAARPGLGDPARLIALGSALRCRAGAGMVPRLPSWSCRRRMVDRVAARVVHRSAVRDMVGYPVRGELANEDELVHLVIGELDSVWLPQVTRPEVLDRVRVVVMRETWAFDVLLDKSGKSGDDDVRSAG